MDSHEDKSAFMQSLDDAAANLGVDRKDLYVATLKGLALRLQQAAQDGDDGFGCLAETAYELDEIVAKMDPKFERLFTYKTMSQTIEVLEHDIKNAQNHIKHLEEHLGFFRKQIRQRAH